MGSTWRGAGGIEVEAIVLGAREVLRVCRWYGERRYLVAYCRDVEELARHVDLATLVEVIPFRRPHARGQSRRSGTPAPAAD
ncbi:aspartyl/asparaginyl beta-hydroxylase (cupin superfamily) [Thermocatellispora tengchongensis]|uniref:Aspartyl/asparaginyl beta-hydroxylase (Cupin superfamily) n=1 Tax=Thermocatellispora tengchongensis TaxID=1073253 RepID=A0A840P8Y3_9ACTN|nr:hypothetical protein [Thermocatellispora tengchongensis]MBB5134311.1 aspartyl/asparaginyl beta-hydroxylase (cupin superfamily) [Thermocatellispora tengchongensis]